MVATEAMAALLAMAGISAATLLWRRRYPYLPVGWFWYLGMLVPVIGVVQVGGQAMADRYTYLPQIGIYLLIAWGACDLTSRGLTAAGCAGRPRRSCWPRWRSCACRQTSSWRDSLTLWNHALACTEPNSLLYYNLAEAEFTLADGNHRENTRQAIKHFKRALDYEPNDVMGHNDLGTALVDYGEVAEAEKQFRRAIDSIPRSWTLTTISPTCWPRRGRPKPPSPNMKRPCGSSLPARTPTTGWPTCWPTAGSLTRPSAITRRPLPFTRKPWRIRPACGAFI